MTSSERRFHIYNLAAAHKQHGWGNPPITTQKQSSSVALRLGTAAWLLQLCLGNNEEMKVAPPASIAL